MAGTYKKAEKSRTKWWRAKLGKLLSKIFRGTKWRLEWKFTIGRRWVADTSSLGEKWAAMVLILRLTVWASISKILCLKSENLSVKIGWLERLKWDILGGRKYQVQPYKVSSGPEKNRNNKTQIVLMDYLVWVEPYLVLISKNSSIYPSEYEFEVISANSSSNHTHCLHIMMK